MLSCRQASQLLSQSLDRRLSWQERTGLRLHLMICDVCRRFGRQLLIMRKAVRLLVSDAEHDRQIRLPDEARERIARMIESGRM